MNKAVNEVGTSVVEFKPFEASLIEYKARYEDVIYDMDDRKQEKQARSDKLQISKVIAELDRVHAVVKAPMLEQVNVLDGERRRIKADLQSVQTGIIEQIKAHEQKLQAIEDALEARVQEIRGYAVFPGAPSSDEVFERVMALGMVVVDESFSHREADAVQAHVETTYKLNELMTAVTLREAEEAELQRLRAEAKQREQEDRDRKIAEQAVEQERLRREAHERQQLASQQKAIDDANEVARKAEAQVQAANERAANAERVAQEARYRQQKHQEQSEQLEADYDHVDKIAAENEALQDMVTLGVSIVACNKIMAAIVAGKVRHIRFHS